MRSPGRPDEQPFAARTQALRHTFPVSDSLDRAAAEVFETFAKEGLEAILLKGPAVATWLYRDADERSYGDLDLLVAPADIAHAERLLELSGYTGKLLVGERGAPSSRIWTRSTDEAVVDLHDRVIGSEGPSEAAWRVLRAETEPLALGGGSVTVLQAPARAVVVALAAAETGSSAPKRLDDLAAALEHLPFETWQRAGALAERIHAAAAFAAALRLLPAGADVAAALQLRSSAPVDVRLRAEAPPNAKGGALAIAWIAGQHTWPGRLRAVARVLAPSPSAMKEASAVARRGFAGLAAAYAWRLVVLAPRRIVPASRAYLAARRRSR